MNLGVVIKIKRKKAIIVTETGEFKAVNARNGMFLGQKILFDQQDVIENNRNGIGLAYSAAIAGMVAVFVFMFTYFGLHNFNGTFAYVDVDINPSVEFAVNRDGIVVNAEPLNDDGRKVLEELIYKDALLEDVILDLVDKSRKYGFIEDNDRKNIILISAALNSDEQEQRNDFEKKLVDNLMPELENLDVNIEMRFVIASKEQRKKAQENKVSMGKYMIYEMARRQGEKLTLESIMSETLENLLLGQDFGVIETEKTPVNTPVKSTATPTKALAAEITPTKTPEQVVMTPANTPAKPTAVPTKAPAAVAVTSAKTPERATTVPVNTPVKPTDAPTKSPATATATATRAPVKATATPAKTLKPSDTPVKTPDGEQSVKVRFYNNNTLSETGVIYMRINVINTGNAPLDLSDLKLRYYYTIDSESEQRFNCDWSSIGAHNVTGSFGKVNPSRNGADTYVEIGFTKEAGMLQPGESVELNARFSKTDNTQYNKADDYSFNSHYYEYVDWDRITAYISGILKWGREP